MPRIYSDERDPQDFCYPCWRRAGYRDIDADDAPDYDDHDYTCDSCGRRLTGEDN